MSQISNNTLRQVFFLLLIILLGIILFVQLQTFIPALLGAYTLYVILRKYMFILQARYKWKKALAAALLMILSFIVILMPIFLLINMMSSKVAFAVQHSSEVLTAIKSYIRQYEVRYGFELLSAENINKLSGWAANTLPSILGATINTVTTIAVMYFILYFMLTDGRKMEAGFYDMVPLKDENVLLLRTEMNSLVYSNALGIPLIAIVQGITGLIMYLILGVKEPMFWFVITCITAMLPIVGAALAYVPIGLLFFANNEVTKGIVMLAYGFGVIGSVDNIFRFWLQKKLGDVHPLITVFGVIIGLNLFGFIGLIFGPILISMFILLIRIYTNEFANRKNPAQ
jgi:predicted PurR-regulated permease PerM